jgi:zinc D-Ala-D-Ala carboxypeptidase
MIDMGMRLSRSFTLAELCKSQTAVRRGIPNVPDAAAVESLRRLCANVLQPVRDHYGLPVSVSSGFRSPRLNRAVKSTAKLSQHSLSEAADFEIFGQSNADVAMWIAANLPFDQIILEFFRAGDPNSGWVHVSYREGRLRRQCLTTADGKTYQPGLVV